jgi:hypothetical protein
MQEAVVVTKRYKAVVTTTVRSSGCHNNRMAVVVVTTTVRSSGCHNNRMTVVVVTTTVSGCYKTVQSGCHNNRNKQWLSQNRTKQLSQQP